MRGFILIVLYARFIAEIGGEMLIQDRFTRRILADARVIFPAQQGERQLMEQAAGDGTAVQRQKREDQVGFSVGQEILCGIG